MPTECSRDLFGYEVVEGRQVVAAFDGGQVTSDAGALLLGAADRALGLVRRLARCFTDGRAPELVEHTVETMLVQRICGIALGYEDLVDHDELRHDPVLAALAGKLEARRKDCAPLAGKSTLNRLEHAPLVPSCYHKIDHDGAAIEKLFVALFLEAHATPPARIILDLDATDDPLHGHQEGRFFHGYYDCYCYLPLYVFCGRHLLAAKLRRSNIDASAGAVEEVARIVDQIRARWPRVKILLRADSGFARDELMVWCEAHAVDYVFGRARNERLVGAIADDLAAAELESLAHGRPARRFADFAWRTRDSWSRARRVVAKAEHLPQGANPRFIVTSLPAGAIDARTLYEDIYCARGAIENRIKEQGSRPGWGAGPQPRSGRKPDLFADRTSAATLRANQLRLWFASFAYVLLDTLRRIGLRHTQFAAATCGTIRLKLLKIGAQVRKSVRRIKVAMASAFPYQAEYHLAYLYLRRAAF
jgi:Transposase DDE domain group 1